MLLITLGFVASGLVPVKTRSWHDLTVIDPYASTAVMLATAIVAVAYNAVVENIECCVESLRGRLAKILRPSFRLPSLGKPALNLHLRRTKAEPRQAIEERPS